MSSSEILFFGKFIFANNKCTRRAEGVSWPEVVCRFLYIFFLQFTRPRTRLTRDSPIEFLFCAQKRLGLCRIVCISVRSGENFNSYFWCGRTDERTSYEVGISKRRVNFHYFWTLISFSLTSRRKLVGDDSCFFFFFGKLFDKLTSERKWIIIILIRNS